MSDKRDMEVRRLFSMASAISIDLLSDPEFAGLNSQEIFESATQIAMDNTEEIKKPLVMNVATVDKNNIAFVLPDIIAIIQGDEDFGNDVFDSELDDNKD